MAKVGQIQERNLEELEREITCGICQEYYTEPKILPCLHYYCRKCVLRLAFRTNTGQPFSCPECRSKAALPEGDVDKLKTAFFANRLKSKVISLARTNSKVEVKCELCEGSSDSKAFCRQCVRFICQQCVDEHGRGTVFKSHDIATLEDLKNGRAKPIAALEPPIATCPVHDDQLIIYCYDCDRLVCRDCTLKDHRQHNFEYTKKAAPNEKSNLLEEAKPLKLIHMKIVNAVKNIQTAKGEIETQKNVTINIIKAYFNELHHILEMREKELVEEAGAIVEEKVDKLTVQENTLSTASAEVQSVLDYTERCVGHCTDGEVMSMHTEMRRTIQHKIQEHSKSERNWDPVEKADMGVEVRCAEALQQLCWTQATICELCIDPTKCSVQLEEWAEVDTVAKGTLITRLYNNVEAKKNCEVTCQLKSLHHSITTDCSIDDDGSGKYSIKYIPTVRGRHELTVLVDGQHVAGSPFPVFVSLPPTQLGKPVQVWKYISKPKGITMTSKGDILVCEEAGGIIKLGANGKSENLITQTELKSLIDIAVDDEDNVYCIDNLSDNILTCDENGGNAQVHQVTLEKGDGRVGLCITKNYLYISERGYENTILIHNRGLQYVRCIQHRVMGQVTAIRTDVHGNIYTTSYSNGTVQVFSSDGHFLRTLCNDNTKLTKPWGICVLGQHVYVTSFSKYSILVFTTEGAFINTFSKLSHGVEDILGPYNICSDKDGHLYICDHGNNRIVCL